MYLLDLISEFSSSRFRPFLLGRLSHYLSAVKGLVASCLLHVAYVRVHCVRVVYILYIVYIDYAGSCDSCRKVLAFHPEAEFELEGDPADVSMQSPFPMLHLLRDADVVAAERTWEDLHAPAAAPSPPERPAGAVGEK